MRPLTFKVKANARQVLSHSWAFAHSRLTTTGTHASNEVTQFCLPSDKGGVPCKKNQPKLVLDINWFDLSRLMRIPCTLPKDIPLMISALRRYSNSGGLVNLSGYEPRQVANHCATTPTTWASIEWCRLLIWFPIDDDTQFATRATLLGATWSTEFYYDQ